MKIRYLQIWYIHSLTMLSLLTACSREPSLKDKALTRKQSQSTVHQKDTSVRRPQKPVPEILSLPPRVPWMRFKPVAGEENSRVQSRGVRLTLVISKPQDNSHPQILIPAKGSFLLGFKPSKNFVVLDPDARDGKAVIGMPFNKMDVFIKTNRTGALSVKDNLFHVMQIISNDISDSRILNGFKGWFFLGTRPLPVPDQWHSQEGKDYILRFKNDGTNQVELVLVQAHNQLSYPVGMKLIDHRGGEVVLPNVARLQVPAGALEKPTLIKLEEVLKVQSTKVLYLGKQYIWLPGYDFVSPVVSLQPIGLNLKKPATLYLPADKNKVAHVNFNEILNSSSKTATFDEWHYESYPVQTNTRQVPSEVKIGRPIKVDSFMYFAKQVPVEHGKAVRDIF